MSSNTSNVVTTDSQQFDFSQIKEDRLNLWRATIDAELQQTITLAAELRQQISEAKTNVKRKYYTKKFKTVSDTVMQLIAVKSQLPPPADTATPTDLVDPSVA